MYRMAYCEKNECCDDRWISADVTGFAQTLSSKVYGQHIATNTLFSQLQGHLHGPNRKALTLSLHGSTGTGKTHVTRLVIEKMFVKGMASKYVHWILPRIELPHFKEMMSSYNEQLRRKIEQAVAECPRAMIIIDEMHLMPSGFIDVIKPFLDFQDTIYKKYIDDYRQPIFFFLSNDGSTAINTKLLENWDKGIPRETLQLEDIEDLILLSVLKNDLGGLRRSKLITGGLITAFIPFLPLERKHINQCIRDSLIENKYYSSVKEIPEDIVLEISDQLRYFPKDSNAFAAYGAIEFVIKSILSCLRCLIYSGRKMYTDINVHVLCWYW